MIKLVRGSALIGLLFILASCAVVPRTSTWDAPREVGKAKVFNAVLQAGGQSGYATTSSDRDSGTASFSRKIGRGDMILSVRVQDAGGVTKVSTTANYAGTVAIAGLHEESIRNFHVLLFRNLDISDPEKSRLLIQELK